MRINIKLKIECSGGARRATVICKKLCSAILIASFAFCPAAKAEALVSRYAVSLSGIHIGDAIVRATLSAKRYKVTLSADVAILLVSTKIQGEATGARSGAKLTPEHFQMLATGGEESAVDIRFLDSKTTGAKTLPQLRGFFDPLSAVLLTSLRPAKPAHPCNNVLPIVLGRNRFDMALRLKTATASPGEPATVTCQVIASVSGPRDEPWEIGFKKLSKPHFWLVERVSLPTPNGTMTVERAETAVSGS
jgi:hypothetical protein